MTTLWNDKYRPSKIEDFVWASPSLKETVAAWIKAKSIPHVMFTGGAGRGKTSLARLLMKELGIPSCDILDFNASLQNKINGVKDLVTGFTSTWALGDTGIKYIILDEADRLTPFSQDFLRGEIEQHSSSCRFILTGNDRTKFTEPMHSRFQEFEFPALARDEAAMRVVSILMEEGVTFEPDNLLKYVDAYYPDLRKIINVLQQRSISGKLDDFSTVDVHTDEFMVDLLQHLLNADSKAARKVVNDNTGSEDYLTIWRFIYTHIGIFNTEKAQDEVLLVIRDAMVRHDHVGDPEINMAASLVEICRAVRNNSK